MVRSGSSHTGECAAVVAGALIAVHGFVKRYNRRLAVDGADLTVAEGEIHGLIGPDGAGKSSLMKAIAGVLTFDAGEVRVFDTSLISEEAAETIKDRIGFMPQGLGLNLYPDLSVEENIDFFAHLRLLEEDELQQRKEQLLAMTRLGKFRTRAMRHLSGGMKQKLGLICTLIHKPRLLILDEPTTGVDPVSRRDFWDILAELLREQGGTALISTAYMDEASHFDRATLMYAGKVIAYGEPDDITAGVRGTVVSFQPRDQLETLHSLKRQFPLAEAVGSAVRVFVSEEPEAAVRLVSAAVSAVPSAGTPADGTAFTTSAPELEDAFVTLLARSSSPTGCWTPALDKTLSADRASSADAAIEAVELTRRFGSFTAANKVSFTVPPGQIFGLLGANGAGKTTVIKMLTGILTPSEGRGHVAGADMRTASRSIKESIGYMSQSFSLYTELTVLENLRFYAGVYGLDRRQTRERLHWVLEMAGLADHGQERAESLPMGLRQRLALGCALVHQPRVLFLDEPTAGVDALGRRQLWEILFHLSRSLGVAILVTTHYMSEAERCDQLAIMYAGRIVANASPALMKATVEAEVGHVLEVEVAEAREATGVLRANGFTAARTFGNHIHFYSKEPEEDARSVREVLSRAGLHPMGSAVRHVSMEDVFVSRVTALEATEEHGSALMRPAQECAA
jgi:ABC-2 type transport system ATP-binding protein